MQQKKSLPVITDGNIAAFAAMLNVENTVKLTGDAVHANPANNPLLPISNVTG